MPHVSGSFSTNPFAMFAPHPAGVTFEGQEAGEQILLLLRPHIFTLVPSILVTVFLILVPILIFPAFGLVNVDIGDLLIASRLFLLTVFWYLFVFGYAFYRFIFWYCSVYLLTNERIIDFDFRGILHKEISYAKLAQIEDISPKMIGFFGTFFNFGNVYIQTAGVKPEFEFEKVAKPDDVAQEISEQVRLEEGEAPGVVA